MTKILRYVAGTTGQLDSGAATEAVVAATAAKEAVEVSVSTVAATAVATGHLALKVEGYSWLKAMHGENGSYIESSEVEVGGHTWTIRCYLNGSKKKDAGFVSLYLHLCSDSSIIVRAEYELALVRPHGPCPEHRPYSQCALIRTSQGLRTFGGNGYSSWGSSRFIGVKELELEQYGFLKDGCFTVRCTVTVVEERTAKEEVVVPADDMARLMGMLCKCGDDRCKREHARPSGLEILANFFYSICRGAL